MFAVPLSGYFYSLAAGVPVVYFGLFELPVLIEADPAKTRARRPALLAQHAARRPGAVHVLAALKHLSSTATASWAACCPDSA
jgi:cytochrome b561